MYLRSSVLAVLIAAGALIASTPGFAQKTRLRTDQVRVQYLPPKDPAHQAIVDRLKQNEFLERLRVMLSSLRLPRQLLLKTEGCNGVVNAYYDDGAVQVCYEYIAEVIRNAPKETTAHGVTPEAAVMGPIMEVFLHEIGHALFDLLEVPLFGREEDAADQLAAYVLLQMGTEDARRLIGGVAYMYAREAQQMDAKRDDFADEHGLPAQRLYNLLCIAFGSQPAFYQDIVDRGILPKKRAEGCEGEHEEVRFAFETLIVPHMDDRIRTRVRERVLAGKWFKPLTPVTAGR